MRPRVLTIAGSDSSGGAGVEADLKVMTCHDVYGMTCITALTAQNTTGVKDVHQIPLEFVEKSLKAVVEDVGVDVVKTGMLPSEDVIELVVRSIDQYGIEKIVVDPVMFSTSGHALIPQEAIRKLIDKLLPKASVITPNVPEAVQLAGWKSEPKDLGELRQLAREFLKLGPKWVLLKGGHIPLNDDLKAAATVEERKFVVDVLVNGEEIHEMKRPWIESDSVHGTGCSLASAIASNLAQGQDMYTAVFNSTNYVYNAIRAVTPVTKLGQGNGPLIHSFNLTLHPFAPGHFVDYLLNHPDIRDNWHYYTHHPFVNAVGAGTLDINHFKTFLVQDYLYLVDFARASSLMAYKCRDLQQISVYTKAVDMVNFEVDRHLKYCASFGITRDMLDKSEPSRTCRAYAGFLLDIGSSGTPLQLAVSMLPCVLGYRLVGERLAAGGEGIKKEGNIYWDWVEGYASDEYNGAAKKEREQVEKMIQGVGSKDIQRCVELFSTATKMEIAFWSAAMEA